MPASDCSAGMCVSSVTLHSVLQRGAGHKLADYSHRCSGMSTTRACGNRVALHVNPSCEKSTKSVDSVENPGRNRAGPVDNPRGAVVALDGPLLESASLQRPPAGGCILENPLLNGCVRPLGRAWIRERPAGYPQVLATSCHAFPCGTRPCPQRLGGHGAEAAPGNPFLGQRSARPACSTGVRCVKWKGNPQVWKELWITREVPVHSSSVPTAQVARETSGHDVYQVFCPRQRMHRLWTIVWMKRTAGGL